MVQIWMLTYKWDLYVNLWLHALFSQVEVFLNNKLVTPSSTAYPYRAYIETILNFSKDAKDSHLTSALFYKDKAGKMDLVSPLAEEANVNTGLKERHAHTRQSRSVAMEGRIHSDLYLPKIVIFLGLCRPSSSLLEQEIRFVWYHLQGILILKWSSKNGYFVHGE